MPFAARALADETLTDTYRYHRDRLDALFAGRDLEHPFALSGLTPGNLDSEAMDPDTEPAEWLERSAEQLADQVHAACDRLVFRPMVMGCNPYGVHFVDSLFGAEIFYHPDSAQWQVQTLNTPVGTLTRPDVWSIPAWRRATEWALAFLEHDLPNVVLESPTLSSALNVAVNLYGEEILIAMNADPGAARHDLRIINDTINELHTWYLGHLPPSRFQPIVAAERLQPRGHGQICGCTTQLISGETYRHFIASLDADVLSTYPHGGMIHVCGAHTQHIPTWRQMPSVRAIQVNHRAAEDLDVYFRGLRDDQVIYVNYFEGMQLAEALDITHGARTVCVGAFEEEEREVLERYSAGIS